MKNLIFLLLIFIIGCASCQKYPDRWVDKKGTPIEPDSCYHYRLCLYYAARRNAKPECEEQFKKCTKDRDYETCKDDKYRWPNQRPQECWDKRQ